MRLRPQSLLKNAGVQQLERSVFNKLLQPGESGVPMSRDEVEVVSRIPKALLVQLPETFASALRAPHETGVLHDAQMFGDGLAREAGASSKFADGCRGFDAKAHDQAQSDRVSQRGEERHGVEQLRGGNWIRLPRQGISQLE